MPINAIISALPSNGGAALTKIQARNNGGTAYDLTTSPAVGTFATTAGIGDTVEIRAVNSVGNGAWSDVKTLSGNPELLVNANFDAAGTWAGTAGTTAFTISGGNLNITNRGDSFLDGVGQDISFAAATYDISVTVVSATSGGVRIKIDATDIAGLTPLTVAGTYTAQYTSPSAATRKFIVSTSQAAASVVVSAVSLKLA
jgi:hypothetical protein